MMAREEREQERETVDDNTYICCLVPNLQKLVHLAPLASIIIVL